MTGEGHETETATLEDPPAATCSPFPECRWPFFPENLSETVDDPAVGCLASPGSHLQSCLDNISRGHQRSSGHTWEEKATFNSSSGCHTSNRTTHNCDHRESQSSLNRRLKAPRERGSVPEPASCFCRIREKMFCFSVRIKEIFLDSNTSQRTKRNKCNNSNRTVPMLLFHFFIFK